MKGITRAMAAVTLTVAIVACSADPLGPGSQRMAPSVSANLVIGSPTISGTVPTSTSCGPTDQVTLSGSSTYVVAYGEIVSAPSVSSCTTPCGTTSEGVLSAASTYVVAYGEIPTVTTTCTVAPAPAPSDSTPLRLSFP